MEQQYFCIKLIRSDGKRGYITPGIGTEKFSFSEKWEIQNVMKFGTYTDANLFVRQNKLQNNKIKAHIRDKFDLEKDKPFEITILGQEIKSKS